MEEIPICSKHNCEKKEKKISSRKKGWYWECPQCIKEAYKRHYNKHKQNILTKKKKFRKQNKDKIAATKRKYYENNKQSILDKNKIYAQNNREILLTKSNEYAKNRRKTDISFRLRRDASRLVNFMLKRYGSSKQNLSSLSYFELIEQNYFEKLRAHIERQFEWWMTWDNQGKYNTKTWNDNDPATWTWQVDHIIPQSHLPYSSMEDENFKQVWALSNLRPLSAKQNIKDGNRR